MLCGDFFFSCATVIGWCESLSILSVTAKYCWSMHDAIVGMLHWPRALSAVIPMTLKNLICCYDISSFADLLADISNGAA